MSGGCDSFNMLMPAGKCTKKENGMDLFDEYTAARGNVAIKKTGMIPLRSFDRHDVSTPPGSQPCERFGVHASLPLVADLFEKGEAAFVANIGSLLEPVTRSLFEDGSVQLPPNIFAHDVATMAAQSLHAQASARHMHGVCSTSELRIERLSTLVLTSCRTLRPRVCLAGCSMRCMASSVRAPSRSMGTRKSSRPRVWHRTYSMPRKARFASNRPGASAVPGCARVWTLCCATPRPGKCE